MTQLLRQCLSILGTLPDAQVKRTVLGRIYNRHYRNPGVKDHEISLSLLTPNSSTNPNGYLVCMFSIYNTYLSRMAPNANFASSLHTQSLPPSLSPTDSTPLIPQASSLQLKSHVHVPLKKKKKKRPSAPPKCSLIPLFPGSAFHFHL